MRRRSLLRALAAGTATAFAGCNGGPLASPTDTPTPEPPAERWRVPLDADRLALAASAGYRYAAFDGQVVALTRDDGTEVGRTFSLDGWKPSPRVAVTGATVAVGSPDGVAGCSPGLDDVAWRVEGLSRWRPVGDRILGVRDGALVGVAAETGDVEWETPLTGADFVSVARAGDGTAFVAGSVAGEIRYWAVETTNGRRLWERSLPEAVNTIVPTALGARTLYVGSDGRGAGRLVALDRADGSVRWSADLGSGLTGPWAEVGDTVVCQANYDRERTVGFDVRTGEERWRRDPVDVLDDTDEWLLTADARGTVRRIEPDGSDRWTVATADGSPTPAPRALRGYRGFVGEDLVVATRTDLLGLAPGDGDRRWRLALERPVLDWDPGSGGVTAWDGTELIRIALP